MRQPAAFGIDVCSRFHYVDLQLLSLFSMSAVQMELQESLDLLSVCFSRLCLVGIAYIGTIHLRSAT